MMYDFCSKLYQELETQLDVFQMETHSQVGALRERLFLIRNVLSKLEAFIDECGFKDDAEEIAFFKDIYPAFYSWFIYFNEFFALQNHVPSGPDSLIREYYFSELKVIDRFYGQRRFVYEYFRSCDTVKDEEYFLHRNYDPLVTVPSTISSRFYTNEGYTFARFLASARLELFISQRLNTLYQESLLHSSAVFAFKKMKWSAEKTDLVELANALKNSLSINSGKVEVMEIVQWLELSFGVDLSAHYRIWSDIGKRKISSRTKFLDVLVLANQVALDDKNRFKPKAFSAAK